MSSVQLMKRSFFCSFSHLTKGTTHRSSRLGAHRMSHAPKSSLASPKFESEDNDEIPIPEEGSWSVHAFLDSLPRPELSPATVHKLHRLTGLHPPEEGSREWMKVKGELEEMVRLVEGVREAKFSATGKSVEDEEELVDGRVLKEGDGMRPPSARDTLPPEAPVEIDRRKLLAHAKKTENGFYVVENSRRGN